MSTELMVKLLKNGDTPPLRNLSTHNISFPLFFPIHGISFWDCFRILAKPLVSDCCWLMKFEDCV